MKKVILAVVAITALTIVSFTSEKSVDLKTISSSIDWTAKKVTGEHHGTIEMKSSKLEYHNNELISASFVVDMTTIKCTDMEGEYADKLVGHLNSKDFFATSTYAESKFTANKILNNGDGTYKITGDLTIKDITNPLTFDAQVLMLENRAVATAAVVIDRAKYDVKYGSGSFFDGLGDNLIYDDFELEIIVNSEL